MREKLIISTSNPGKIAEFRFLLKSLPFHLTTPIEERICMQVDEIGATFEENAVLKATAYARKSGLVALADDSGIEVEALGGRPGIHSARYGGESLSDVERVELLLHEMKNVPWDQRRAVFRAVVAVVWPDGRILVKEGAMEGILNTVPLGNYGFGYDPVFYLPECEVTTAQLKSEKKNMLSHRSKATIQIVETLLDEFG